MRRHEQLNSKANPTRTNQLIPLDWGNILPELHLIENQSWGISIDHSSHGNFPYLRFVPKRAPFIKALRLPAQGMSWAPHGASQGVWSGPTGRPGADRLAVWLGHDPTAAWADCWLAHVTLLHSKNNPSSCPSSSYLSPISTSAQSPSVRPGEHRPVSPSKKNGRSLVHRAETEPVILRS